MFKPVTAFNSFSVDDLQKAKSFYQETLGLETVESEMGTLDVTGPGGCRFLIYQKPNHAPATYTTLNFVVPDIEAAVRELKSKGVQFESYDMPELKTDENNIARGNGPTIAWFTDPAGNIIGVIEEYFQ